MEFSKINFSAIPLPIYFLLLGLIIVVSCLIKQIPTPWGNVEVAQKLSIGRIVGIAIGFLIILLTLFTTISYPSTSNSEKAPKGPNAVGAISTVGPTPTNSTTTCYGQAQHIDPIAVSSTVVRLHIDYSVTNTSLCMDINFKPVKANSNIKARVVFLDVATGETKGHGAWVPLSSSEWTVLATDIKRETRYTLEFQADSGQGIVEGCLAA
ncbi:MAG: hypothetical protein JO125_09340 [Chloroflexi bacterium]|nr:hypothetical protein [Chloroflexota bacterium]